MTRKAKILVFAGSARTQSFNKKLARIAADQAAAAGADVTVIDLAEHRLPMYDGDVEAESGVPDGARTLRKLFMAQDGFIIASPEYNSSIAPLLKNTIDWISRPDGEDAMVAAYRGKIAGLVSASPGALGGLRGLVHLRSILGNIGVYMVPQQHVVPGAADAFDDDGGLARESDLTAVGSVVSAVVDLVNARIG